MKTSNDFLSTLNDVFALFGAIEAKRMFGGYGLYHQGVMFGLVSGNELFLKTDDESAQTFIEQGLLPFEYSRDGGRVQLSYYAAPEVIFDDPEEAKEWAERAYKAALRSSSATRGK
ncbi:TfoX/Sxy family protein [Hydrogenovibrio thermophilus]|uniref:TfoX family protein n=1 Tax=Hydrogenovibrio thermophilus TaxID=265883 RepID=A0A410H2Y6_9GAMM|nr:TfoX/Sxy family protein [Hydrogenovibrio thermophilus]QAB15298.1 TfoX family protein [Hydrogenovibrio thermophilus]